MIQETDFFMWSIMIFASLFVISILYMIIRKCFSGDVVLTAFVTLFAGWFIICAGIIPLVDRHLIADKTVKLDHELWIYSLMNQTNSEGSFMLGSGSIEGVEYYYVFYRGVDGYRRAKYRVYHVALVETNDRNPEIVERSTFFSGGLIQWKPSGEGEYIMYVPKGTIIRKFEVN